MSTVVAHAEKISHRIIALAYPIYDKFINVAQNKSRDFFRTLSLKEEENPAAHDTIVKQRRFLRCRELSPRRIVTVAEYLCVRYLAAKESSAK